MHKQLTQSNPLMAIQTVLIINKSGGLVYQRDFLASSTKLSSNDYLILAGTLQGVTAIASQVTPKALQISGSNLSKAANETEYSIPYAGPLGVKDQKEDMGSFLPPDYFTDSFASWSKSGLKHVTTDQFSLFLYQSMTGMKFVAISTQSSTSNMAVSFAENFLRKAYCLYADFVMKNPFYEPEMPIRCELFDKKLTEFVQHL